MARKITLNEQLDSLQIANHRLITDKDIVEMELATVKHRSAENQMRILTLEAIFNEEIVWLEAQQIPATRERADYLRKEIAK